MAGVNRCVETDFAAVSVQAMLQKEPWLRDLLRRAERLAGDEPDSEVLRRACGFLIDAFGAESK